MLETEALIIRDGDLKEPGKPWYDMLKDNRLQDWQDANVVVYVDAYNRPFVVKNKFGSTHGIDLYQDSANAGTAARG